MLAIETIDSTARFANLRDEWNQLLSRSKSDGVFLTHEWLYTWWKHLADHRELSIVAARDSGRLVGILPLCRRDPQYSRMMPQMLEFIGAGEIGSDYLDVIADREHEDAVLDAFAHHLASHDVMIQFAQLSRGSSFAFRLARRLALRAWMLSETKINVCPFVSLKGHTWQSYLDTLGSSHRANFQRRVRKLEQTGGFRLERNTDLDVVIELHKNRWGSNAAGSEAFQTPSIIAFHREFTTLAREKGWLRLLSIWLGEAPAAALYGLHYGSTFSFYQSGFDEAFAKHSVGLVMMGLAIRTAIEDGAAEYDLLHGGEEYKFHWAREVRELGRLELYPPDTRGALYRHCIAANRTVRRMARRMLIRT